MSTLEHIKARIVTIAERTRPYLKKAWTIGCAYAVKFVDWCRAIYHKAKPLVIAGWKNLLPYLKQAWQIAGVAAEKVADCCKETYRLAKPHVIAGWKNLHPYLKRAWQIAGVAAEKVTDWGKETYRLSKAARDCRMGKSAAMVCRIITTGQKCRHGRFCSIRCEFDGISKYSDKWRRWSREWWYST